ncbi:hypothetical protein LJR289_005769 [Pseudoduganella sp. LjRoot289]|uniref:tyrosine-type recombinase/integrase n=1 Tax=Pseudoduganella sp. LjRoot289 TaxID=3342314 RepID=UPI003ECE2F51
MLVDAFTRVRHLEIAAYVFPVIGKKPIANIKPRDVLAAVQKMEARGAVESAHRVKQVCGQIFRFAVALDLVERDITADLRGALAPTVKGNFAAFSMTPGRSSGGLMSAALSPRSTRQA